MTRAEVMHPVSHRRPSKYDVRDRPLPPFDHSSKCPKCAHDDVNTSHRAATSCSDGDNCFTCPAEALVRTCQRCRFQWAEAVLS